MINQDSLEEHFGSQRMKGDDGNENLDVFKYQYNELKLQVAKSEKIHVLQDNTKQEKTKQQLI